MSSKQIGQRQSSTGFACPKCGTATAVIDTRPGPEDSGAWRRRRGCGCGHKFTTYEIEFDGAPEFLGMLYGVMEKIGAARFHAEAATEAMASLIDLVETQRGAAGQKPSKPYIIASEKPPATNVLEAGKAMLRDCANMGQVAEIEQIINGRLPPTIEIWNAWKDAVAARLRELEA